MNAIRTILVAAAFGLAAGLAASAHAQNCSGGADGGMDATGNQCSRFNPGDAIAATSKMNSAPRNAGSRPGTTVARQVARLEGTVSRERAVAAANRAAQPAKEPESDSVAPQLLRHP